MLIKFPISFNTTQYYQRFDAAPPALLIKRLRRGRDHVHLQLVVTVVVVFVILHV